MENKQRQEQTQIPFGNDKQRKELLGLMRFTDVGGVGGERQDLMRHNFDKTRIVSLDGHKFVGSIFMQVEGLRL